MSTVRTDLTLFDLDHTLLDGDSNALWLAWLVAQGAAPAERLERQAAFYAQYKAGSLDIDAYLRFHLSLLDGRPLADWLPLRDAFVAACIVPRVGRAAREAVARHRDRGEHIAVVTATHDFLAAGIVALFGRVPLVATRCELAEGRFTGRTDGPPCFGPAKRGFVDAWLAAQGLAWTDFGTVRFYSDSANDLPLLEAASEAVVVDPDPRLAEIAAVRGWRRLSWRVGVAGV